MLSQLLEVLLRLGDWHAAAAAVARILRIQSGHLRAQRASSALARLLAGHDDEQDLAVLQPRRDWIEPQAFRCGMLGFSLSDTRRFPKRSRRMAVAPVPQSLPPPKLGVREWTWAQLLEAMLPLLEPGAMPNELITKIDLQAPAAAALSMEGVGQLTTAIDHAESQTLQPDVAAPAQQQMEHIPHEAPDEPAASKEVADSQHVRASRRLVARRHSFMLENTAALECNLVTDTPSHQGATSKQGR